MRKHYDVVLVTIRGMDAPGITSCLTKVIASYKGVKIIDIEQTVVHGRLLLSVLLAFINGSKSRAPVLKDLLFAAKELGVNIDFEVFNEDLLKREDVFQYVITCIGQEIGAGEISAISHSLAAHGVNIDKIARLSAKNISCIEMIAHAAKIIDPKKLSRSLLSLSNQIGVDIAIQKYDLLRRAKRLVIFDMDSTLVQSEVIDELARRCGKFGKIAKITERVTNGEMSYRDGLLQRVKMLSGLRTSDLEAVYRGLKFTKGAKDLIRVLKKLGYKTAIISGGLTFFTDRLKSRLGLDYAYANILEIKGGMLTGRIVGNIIDEKRKASLLEYIAEKEGIELNQTIAIGDGANDISMLSKAGLGIAFRAKPIVREKANYSITSHKGLDSILYLLGIPEKEVLFIKTSNNQ